jgi:hypothetical protein
MILLRCKRVTRGIRLHHTRPPMCWFPVYRFKTRHSAFHSYIFRLRNAEFVKYM